jgi:nucleoside-diphosphate-sugar epimerase
LILAGKEKMAMAQVFVTGGSGFVGRRLIEVLVERGDAVRALARSEKAAGAVRQAGAEVVVGDLDEVAAMQAGMAGCEVVYHSAALVQDWGDPADFYRVNVVGTEKVLAAAKAAGVGRLVHVSTEAVLVDGRGPIRNADEKWPKPARPLPLYPYSKGLAEDRVIAANGDGLTTVVVRPRFVWGKGDTSLLPAFVEAIKEGRFRWMGDGRHLTSTCHVDNVCEGMVLAAEHGRGGEIYFLTDGESVEFRQFVTDMLATQGVRPGEGVLPLWLAGVVAAAGEGVWRLLRLKGQPPLTRIALALMSQEVTVNDGKARRELGYNGRVSVADGLAGMKEER